MNIQPLEPIESINKRLIDYYGKFENLPKFRVIWSSDQYERRMIKETPEGLSLLNPMIATMPKYSYARDRYILEKITPIPEAFIDDVGAKLSYEPIWVFEDARGNPLPPKWEAIQVIFQAIENAMVKKGPYKQDEKEGNSLEALEYQAKILEEQIYGDDSSIVTNLGTGSAVGYGPKSQPHSKTLNNPIKGI